MKGKNMLRKLPLLPFTLAVMVYANSDSTDQIQDLKDLEISETTATNSVVTISREDMNRISSSRTVDGMLTNIAGVDISRTGPGGNKAKGISLRGFDESRYIVVLNGRPLNGAGAIGGDYIDWNAIPVDQIEKIEIIRGSKTAEYGNTLGGVIRITTAADFTEPSTFAKVSYGVTPDISDKRVQNQSADFAFSHRNSIGKTFDYSLTLGHLSNEGFLRNNFVKQSTVGGNFTFHLPADIDLSGSVIITSTNRGFILKNQEGDKYYDPFSPISDEDAGGGPGIRWKGGDYYFGERSHWNNIRRQFDLSLSKKFEKLTVTAQAYLNDQDRTERYYDIKDTNMLVLERFAKPEDKTGGWLATAEQHISNHKVKYGIEGVWLRYSGTDIRHIDSSFFKMIPTEYDEVRNSISRYSLYLQDEFTLSDTLLTIRAGFRYDRFIGNATEDTFVGSGADKTEETKRNGFNPNLGIETSIWPGGTIGIDAALSYRFPNPPEFYWYYNGYQPENRGALEPEHSFQFEGTLEQKLLNNRLNAAVRGYAYRVNEYIRGIFGYRPSRVIYNIERVDFYGLELEAAYQFPKYFSLRSNYSYQTTSKYGDFLDKSTGETDNLPELPEHKANAGIQFMNNYGTQIDLTMRTTGMKKYINGSAASGNIFDLSEIDPFTTFNLSGKVPVIKNDKITMNIRGAVENLFNLEYQEEAGFPMPGITFLAGFDAAF